MDADCEGVDADCEGDDADCEGVDVDGVEADGDVDGVDADREGDGADAVDGALDDEGATDGPLLFVDGDISFDGLLIVNILLHTFFTVK